MPGDTPNGRSGRRSPLRSLCGRLHRLVGRTAAALRAAAVRPDAGLLMVGGGVAYLLVYLVAIGDLGPATTDAISFRLADDPSRAFVRTGFLRFDALALVTVGGVAYLLSPLDLVVASILGSLVGANLGLSYLGFVQPRTCGLEASTGALAGLPALLSGAACCGPAVFLVVGVQASATLLSVFELLVPLAALGLVAGLLAIGRQVDPALI